MADVLKKINGGVLLFVLGLILCLLAALYPPPLSESGVRSSQSLQQEHGDHVISSTCIRVYDEGGAPAVFEAPECPHWVLSNSTRANCQMSTTQGRRRYQEDRVSCDLHINMPFISIGQNGSDELGTKVGVVAVFDGHIGTEASEMASKIFLDYFYLHSAFQAFKKNSSDGLVYKSILKEALTRTIHDIDAAFTMEAHKFQLYAGSTAVVVVLVDDQILVANVGDSKALLCSEDKIISESGAISSRLLAKELTVDHNAYLPEERSRIEASGGIIYEWHDPPLVNRHFPMTRAIGDVPLKPYGIIAVPELTDWQPLNTSDIYLVVASDGIFESLKPQQVCNLLHKEQSCSAFSSLADCIVGTAFDKGSTDNLSAAVVPLQSSTNSNSR